MALKDMKSDLSKFRMPKKEPLESKKREDIKSNQNQTPLSSLVDSAPKIPRSQTTTNKEGVNPNKVQQGDKFKGETSATPMDNSEKFKGETTPTRMSLEQRYLGQTTPEKMDNSPNYLGETNPQPMDNSEKFLGETTPSKMDSSEQFLGETTPNRMDTSERFLGETNPSKMDNSEKFLGETTPKTMDNSENYLGETTPTSAVPQSKFLGETNPTPMDNTSKFLGETTQKSAAPESKFLGETTPTEMNNESQYLGETTPNSAAPQSQYLGETTPTEMNNQSQYLGETTPTDMDLGAQFLGETTPRNFKTPNNKDKQAVTPPSVDMFTNDKAIGFTQNFTDKTKTKFVGINPDNTQFDNVSSLYSNFSGAFNGLSFRAGYGKFKVGKETGLTQRYNFDTKYYVDTELTNPSISKLHEMKNSPSFLDEMYHKYNLRDDAFNLGTAAFAHPLIMRGIQRKPIDKGEPQKWGFGFPIDDGLVRGGIVTAVDRSVVDAVRLGKWMISVNGLLWGIKNVGLQASNPNVETLTGKRLTKTWTPINTIASAIGGFVGLRPKRHGFTPFDPEVETYSATQTGKKLTHIDDITLGVPITGNRLIQLYNETFTIAANTISTSKFVGEQFNTLTLGKGGPNSLYGLIPNGLLPSRNVSTLPDLFSGYTIQTQYNPTDGGTNQSGLPGLPFDRDGSDIGKEIKPYTEFIPERKPTSDPNDVANKKVGITHNDEFTYGENRSSDLQGSDYEGNDLGLIWESYTKEGRASDGALNRVASHTSKESPFEKERNTEGNIHPIEKNTTAGEIIKNYETIAYGKIPKRVAGDTTFNDFRNLYDGNGKKRADNQNYTTDNIEARVGFPSAPAHGTDRSDRTKSLTSDAVQTSAIGAEVQNDLIKLLFNVYGGGSQIQFRGAVSGITETFSPSWDSFKYNGRADQAYKYSTFERSLSFNFQVYPTSKAELKPLYKKLERLSSMTMPTYGTNGYTGTLVTFTLGNLWKDKLSFIESLSYTFSDEVPWDVDEEASMGIDVAIGMKILDDAIPQYAMSNVYDLG